MKKYQKFAAALTALLILSNCFPVFSAETVVEPPETLSDNSLMTEVFTVQSEDLDMPIPDEIPILDEELILDEAFIPDEAPMFNAKIEYSPQGYVVKGTFTEFSEDISHIQTLYSLDGKKYHECGLEWDLHLLGTEDPAVLAKLHTQTCLYSNFEPLRSYLAGTLDRFYLKLHITMKNGNTYESKTAVIERGEVQAVPEGTTFTATFASSIRVREMNPFNYYGKYQLTVGQTATPEEISAFLPDTLPIQVDIYSESNFVAVCIVDCPVTWKSLSLPQLTAGESVTILDAAEEIVVPDGTLLNTPIGIFRLDEALPLSQDMLSDEVRLILNVISENENPTGVLARENDGLEVAFNFKPTGATAIHTYTFLEQESEWVELPDIQLLDAVNAQPSTANSGYTLVICNDQEPYQSYLAAETEGSIPTPFLVGIKIEGGVYHGRQLILAWPSTYELPLNLPNVGGSGGNENNAGSDNKDDSTDEGQRPNLPKNPKKKQESHPSDLTQTPNENKDSPSSDLPQTPNNNQDSSSSDSAQASNNNQDVSQTNSTNAPDKNQNVSPQDSAQTLKDNPSVSPTDSTQPLNENQKASSLDSAKALNEHQNASTSGISANIDQQSQESELTSDMYKNSPQVSMAAVAVTATITAICIAAITVKVNVKKKKIVKI